MKEKKEKEAKNITKNLNASRFCGPMNKFHSQWAKHTAERMCWGSEEAEGEGENE